MAAMAEAREGTSLELCNVCRRISFKKLITRRMIEGAEDDYDGPVHILGTVDEIRHRAPICSFCFLIAKHVAVEEDLRERVADWRARGNKHHSSQEIQENHFDGPIVLHITRTDCYAYSDFAKVRLHRLQIEVSGESRGGYGVLSLQPSHSDRDGVNIHRIRSTVDIQLLQSWMTACQSQHGACCEEPDWYDPKTDRLPNLRVIDVDKRCITLLPEKSEYCALSYVWGSVQDDCCQGQTTLENIADFTKENALTQDLLSETLNDAFLLASQLGFRYLWVDRLCIIQNDQGDISSLLPIMDSIYASAALTIIDASGQGVHSGLAGTIRHPRMQQNHVRINASFTLLELPRKWAFNDCMWKTRAWTLQEQLCSRRSLVFTDDLVFWSCWEEDFYEYQPRGKHQSFDMTDVGNKHGFHLKQDNGTGMISRSLNKFDLDHYQDMTKTYVQRKMTKEDDALDAFRGILNRVTQCTGIPFHWGHPQMQDFGRTLIWISTSGLRRTMMCNMTIEGGDSCSYRVPFPSWSWTGWNHQHFNPNAQYQKNSDGLSFYKLDKNGKTAKLSQQGRYMDYWETYNQTPRTESQQEDHVVNPHDDQKEEVSCGGSDLAVKQDTRIVLKKWQEVSTINETYSPNIDGPFQDSGKLVFWTSHARVYVSDIGMILNAATQGIGQVYTGLDFRKENFTASHDLKTSQPLDFVVASYTPYSRRRRSSDSSVRKEKGAFLELLQISWVDKENHIAERVRSGQVDEDAWIELEREWIMVTLQ